MYAFADPTNTAIENALPDRMTEMRGAVSATDLPPARLDSVAEILVVAAGIADLTVERAKKLSRLDDERTMSILSDLESQGRLVRRTDRSDVAWGRSER